MKEKKNCVNPPQKGTQKVEDLGFDLQTFLARNLGMKDFGKFLWGFIKKFNLFIYKERKGTLGGMFVLGHCTFFGSNSLASFTPS